jgi:hypothetical protein
MCPGDGAGQNRIADDPAQVSGRIGNEQIATLPCAAGACTASGAPATVSRLGSKAARASIDRKVKGGDLADPQVYREKHRGAGKETWPMTRRIYVKPAVVKRDALPLLAAAPTASSDRRLKTDIVAVGMLGAGIPLYRFRYIGQQEVYVGVMAQDVLPLVPEAVITDASGYMRVDYQRLGTRMMSLQEWEAGGLAAAA